MLVLDMFSGLGGMSLGVRLAVPTARTVAYLEREAACIAILAARMASRELDAAPVWTDVQTFDGRPWCGRVDLITAGFPCQPWSLAGKRGGTSDDRWLWDDISRIINEVQPSLVFLENVPGLAHGGLEHVCWSLAEAGFDAEWGCFSKAQMGAVDKRERLFLLAYHGCRSQHWLQPKRLPGGLPETITGGAGQGVANSSSSRLGASQSELLPGQSHVTGSSHPTLGNNNNQGGPRAWESTEPSGRGQPQDPNKPMGDSLRQGLEGWEERELLGQRPAPQRAGNPFWPPDRNPDNWQGVPEVFWPAVERPICGMAPRIASTMDVGLEWMYGRETMFDMFAVDHKQGQEPSKILQQSVLCEKSDSGKSLQSDGSETSLESGQDKGAMLRQMWDYFQKTGTAPPGLHQASGSNYSLHGMSSDSGSGRRETTNIQATSTTRGTQEDLSDLQSDLLQRASYARYTLWFLKMSIRLRQIMQLAPASRLQLEAELRELWGRVYPDEIRGKASDLFSKVRKYACLGKTKDEIGRVNRLRALGNSANPLQSAVAFRILAARCGLHLDWSKPLCT